MVGREASIDDPVESCEENVEKYKTLTSAIVNLTNPIYIIPAFEGTDP